MVESGPLGDMRHRQMSLANSRWNDIVVPDGIAAVSSVLVREMRDPVSHGIASELAAASLPRRSKVLHRLLFLGRSSSIIWPSRMHVTSCSTSRLAASFVAAATACGNLFWAASMVFHPEGQGTPWRMAFSRLHIIVACANSIAPCCNSQANVTFVSSKRDPVGMCHCEGSGCTSFRVGHPSRPMYLHCHTKCLFSV